MAISPKKDKLIEEAQKFVLRGQFDKAAKIYEQIVALEPAAMNLHQKLAELLIKSGQSADARKELELIGKHFSTNGFYLKAIAVYKQLQKLFPDDISLSLTLAELNEKHGLIANALSEYKLVYEFYEKDGNIREALNILDKMQQVDPQNIPIKIKLAEAYFQHTKSDESCAVFKKIAALLLERRDSATFSKICTRALQLFPDRPDFILDVLAEQIKQGNAAITTDSIQGILRTNPKNKRAWDLIIQAYQQLNNPQRLKIAYQHYLNYFPSEPTAILGLISSSVSDGNLAGALEQLDKCEATLLTSGFAPQLEQIYQNMSTIEPINIRILEGMIKVAKVTGNENEVNSLTLKLTSLQSLSGQTKNILTTPESPLEDISDADDTLSTIVSSFLGDDLSEQTAPSESVGNTCSPASIDAVGHVEAATEDFQQPDEDFEIDIDIDLDSTLDFPEQVSDDESIHKNWLDSVDNLFDTIDTSPRSVKFGNEMEDTDAQSHFDLGQAFKEMGLYDEAINEFRRASQDSSRRVECMIMQCACLRERGEVEKSVTMLQTLLKSELSIEEICAVKYELATGYETLGKYDEASLLLNDIHTTNPEFRDIRSRLSAVNSADSLDFSDDDLKDF